MRKLNYIVISVFSLILLLGNSRCTSIGSNYKLLAPEIASKLKKVGIWPPKVILPFEDGLDIDVSDISGSNSSYAKLQYSLEKYAELSLVNELKKMSIFDCIFPDSLDQIIYKHRGKHIYDVTAGWDIAAMVPEIDAILTTVVRIRHSGTHGNNTYISMELYDIDNWILLLEINFNTMWGKSYFTFSPPDLDKTIPDGIKGAVKTLKKIWYKKLNK